MTERLGPELIETKTGSGIYQAETQYREALSITPEMLLEDNGSDETEVYLYLRQQGRRKNKTALFACSDARKFFPDVVDVVRSIGLGAAVDTLSNTKSSVNTSHVVLCHFDCGAHIAYGLFASQTDPLEKPKGIKKYIAERVGTTDNIVQGWRVAREIAIRQGEAVASWQSHTTLRTHPYAVFGRGGVLLDGIDVNDPKSYRPVDTRLDATRPYLAVSEIPERYHEFFDRMKLLTERDPFPETAHRNQNPFFYLLDGNTIPTSVWLPGTLGKQRGLTFKTTIPYLDGKLLANSIGIVTQQAEYPLTRFSNLKTLIVSTPDGKADHIVRGLLSNPIAANWARQAGNKIIVATTKEGKINNASYYVR